MMGRYWVELSGENVELGRAESIATARMFGGGAAEDAESHRGVVVIELPTMEAARKVAARLALARRVVGEWSDADVQGRLGREGADGRSAAVRRIGHFSSAPNRQRELATFRAYTDGGGRVDLRSPQRMFWVRLDHGEDRWGEEVAATDRAGLGHRRMPKLPFQRPVALPPRLGRAIVNLARVRPRDRVVDPFLGTGALLAEAGLVGASLTGIDQDVAMVRGAAKNLAHLGLAADELVVDDAADAASRFEVGSFDALVTDPPYGRASTTRGEAPLPLLLRVLDAWAPKLTERARIGLVAPAGTEWTASGWSLEWSVRDRVHRSLTREFTVYRRARGRG